MGYFVGRHCNTRFSLLPNNHKKPNIQNHKTRLFFIPPRPIVLNAYLVHQTLLLLTLFFLKRRSATEDTATCFPEPGESFDVPAGSCSSLIFFEPPRGLASSGLPPHVVPRVRRGYAGSAEGTDSTCRTRRPRFADQGSRSVLAARAGSLRSFTEQPFSPRVYFRAPQLLHDDPT